MADEEVAPAPAEEAPPAEAPAAEAPAAEAPAAPVKKEFGQQADMSNPTPFPASVPSTPPTEGGEAPVAAEIIQALESVVEEGEPAPAAPAAAEEAPAAPAAEGEAAPAEAAPAAEGEAAPAAEGEAAPAAEGEAAPAAEGEAAPPAEGEAAPPAEGEAPAAPAEEVPPPPPKEEDIPVIIDITVAPSGEVDQYGFPVIPKGKRTPIKVLGSKLSNILRYKEDSQKSKEQLDIEKQNIILSRIVPFEIEGLDYNGLCERAKALHQVIWNLEANCYDYQQKFERQNYDMMELAERARQMNRASRRKTPTGHTGLGGSVFSWIAERYKDAPPKMSLFSKYERQKDRRTLTERRLIFEDFEAAKAANLIVFKPEPLPVN